MTGLARRRFVLATGYVLAGLGVLVAAAVFNGRFPTFWPWLLFAIAFAVLEYNSVEVNDRMFQSSSVMVVLTAGIVFALDGTSAALGLATIAALGPLLPDDLRQRRWFQPMANMGQLDRVGRRRRVGARHHVEGRRFATRADLARILVAGVVASAVYTLINWQLVRFAVSYVYRTRDFVPWSRMSLFVGSLLTMGIVGALLGTTIVLVAGGGDPAVTPLILVVYLIGHLSLSSYAQLREAHEATLRGFVKALEAKDLYTRGHTERVAYFAQLTGQELSFSGTQLERLRWAALIHDVGKLAVPGELIRKKGRLSSDEYLDMKAHAHLVEEILAEVEFLEPMVDIASSHHSHYDGSGYGGRGHRSGTQPSLESCILAVADAFDAMTSTRSYRMALTQAFAIEEIRQHAGTQFHPDVIDALERALKRSGRPTDRGISTTRNWPAVWPNSRWWMKASESNHRTRAGSGSCHRFSGPRWRRGPFRTHRPGWLYIVFGIFALAAAAQLGVPSANGRRFGLPVAVGVAAPIFLVEGSQVDLPSVFVVYGAGMAIGGLIFSIRPTSKADSSDLRSLDRDDCVCDRLQSGPAIRVGAVDRSRLAGPGAARDRGGDLAAGRHPDLDPGRGSRATSAWHTLWLPA